MSVPPVEELPDIQVDTGALREGARSLRDESRRVGDEVEEAQFSWRGLRTAYRHEGTQEQVWAGLDLLEEPVESWVEALGQGAGLVADLASTCDGLIFRRAALGMRRPEVEAQRSAAIASAEPAAITAATAAVTAFNEAVVSLTQEWVDAQGRFADALGGIASGEDGDLPLTAGAMAPGDVNRTGLGTAIGKDLRSDDAAFRRAEDPVRVGDRPAGGHSALWEPGSLSRSNIQAFLDGDPVVPELPAEHLVGMRGGGIEIDGLARHSDISTADGLRQFETPYEEVIP